jgi:hypothetical protein
MQRLRHLVLRLCGLLLSLLLFGHGFAATLEHLGERFEPTTVGVVVTVLIAVGLLFLVSWSVSRFRYADLTAAAMAALLITVVALRALVHHRTWVSLVLYGLIIVGALLQGLGWGRSEDQTAMGALRRASERRALPRLNRRRAGHGLNPVSSFTEASNEVPPWKRRRRNWLTGFTGLLIFGNTQALLSDASSQGHASSAANYPLIGLLAVGGVLIALSVGSWWFSDYRHRTIVLVLSVALGVAMVSLTVAGLQNTISPVDIIEDVAWLVLAFLQTRDDSPKAGISF